MKRILIFVITIMVIFTLPVIAYADSDDARGGIYLIENDSTLEHTGNLDNKEYNSEVPYGTTFICGNYENTTYNPKLLSSFKVTVTFGEEKISLDLFKSFKAGRNSSSSTSVDKGGISFTLEDRIFPRIWIIYSSAARTLGNNSLSLADTYKISAAWTYDGTKYEAKTTVNPVKGRDFSTLSFLRIDGTHNGKPLATATSYSAQNITDKTSSTLSPAYKKSYYSISMPGKGLLMYIGCDEDPASDIFKNESIYYQTGTQKKKAIESLSITIPESLAENKVYNLKFKNRDGIVITCPVKLNAFGIIDNLETSSCTNSVRLSWDAADDVSSYLISTSTGSVEVKEAEYNFTNLKPGSQYYVSIRAKANIGSYSQTASPLSLNLLTKPLKVTNVKASSASGKLNVSWKVKSGTGYQIQVAANKAFTKNLKTYTVKGSNVKSKKITGLTKGKTYYVRVRAINAYNDDKVYGSWSSTVKAKL